MIKLPGTETKVRDVTVEVSASTLFETVVDADSISMQHVIAMMRQKMARKLKFPKDAYITDDGVWAHTYEVGFGHYETEETRHYRNATQDEICICELIDNIEAILTKQKLAGVINT